MAALQQVGLAYGWRRSAIRNNLPLDATLKSR
jgi:hypothetical protein